MNETSTYLLVGIDGGGSGCRITIADADGTYLGDARGGPANFTSDPHATVANLLAAIQTAADNADLEDGWTNRCVAHLGLAGVMEPSDAVHVADAMPFRATAVTDDRATSLAGALGARDGMLAAIGTGTIVAAKSGARHRHFGGWGLRISDQASGAWLGHKLLRRAILAHDGILAQSELTRSIMRRFNDKPAEAVRFAQDAGPSDYAQFAPIVVEAASGGDCNGLALMNKGAGYLSACIKAAGLIGDDVLCLTGGVGPKYEPYLDQIHRNRVRPPLGTALHGALFLAQRALEARGGTP